MFPDKLKQSLLIEEFSEINNLKFWYFFEEALPEAVHRVFCESWKIYLTTNNLF